MHIKHIQMRWGTGDNYAYLVTDDSSGQSAIIDPAEPSEVLPSLKDVDLKYIINTHHHYDHSGGNKELHSIYPQIPVVAGADSPLVSLTPKDGESFKLGQNVKFTAVHTPCHTQDSICYYVTDDSTQQKVVFTGDTLFNAGCGRFFEGSPEEMVKALGKLAKLPSETVVYPGHEYTKGNLKFVKTVLNNSAVKDLDAYASSHEETTGKFTIGGELTFNPFMMTADVSIQNAVKASDQIEAMKKLRELKNKM